MSSPRHLPRKRISIPGSIKVERIIGISLFPIAEPSSKRLGRNIVGIYNMPLVIQSLHQAERTAFDARVVILVERVAVPGLIVQTRACIGITKSELNSIALVIAIAIDSVGPIRPIPSSSTVICDVVIIERSGIVVITLRLICDQADDHSISI